MGGGFLIVPVLHVLLGIPINLSVGAGACQVLGPSTTSLLARRTEREHLRLPLIIAGGQIVGTFLGAASLEGARRFRGDGQLDLMGRTVPLVELLVLSLYLLLLLSIGLFALLESRRPRTRGGKRQGLLAGLTIPPFCHPVEFEGRDVSISVLAWFGLCVGFLSGLLGMSGGLLVLPGLIYLLGMRTQQAVRSSLVIVWIGAIPNTVAHAWHENIDLPLVLALLVGGTVGARLGSEVGSRWAGPQLRKRFGWLLLATAAMVGYRLLNLVAG